MPLCELYLAYITNIYKYSLFLYIFNKYTFRTRCHTNTLPNSRTALLMHIYGWLVKDLLVQWGFLGQQILLGWKGFLHKTSFFPLSLPSLSVSTHWYVPVWVLAHASNKAKPPTCYLLYHLLWCFWWLFEIFGCICMIRLEQTCKLYNTSSHYPTTYLHCKDYFNNWSQFHELPSFARSILQYLWRTFQEKKRMSEWDCQKVIQPN